MPACPNCTSGNPGERSRRLLSQYYGSGYLPARDDWKLGGTFGRIFFAVFMALGALSVLSTG
jgi:hypothetical protein